MTSWDNSLRCRTLGRAQGVFYFCRKLHHDEMAFVIQIILSTFIDNS